MAQRKRKTSYPVANTSRRPPPADVPIVQPRTSVAIDTTALAGRKGLAVGAKVRIAGGGLYAGEAGVIERFAGSVVPAAVVRTELGRTRQVRTIDLEPIPPEA
jgi:hypothetical protein